MELLTIFFFAIFSKGGNPVNAVWLGQPCRQMQNDDPL
jgi:hypothetical protein